MTAPAETLGVYVQIPFCASKCSFCNFSSRVGAPAAIPRYAAALRCELERLPDFYARASVRADLLSLPVDSVYFGGGTPPLVGGAEFEEICTALKKRFRFSPGVEFTVEATPGSADREFLQCARALGVNRLSIGAQSFDDRELRRVGRLHSAAATADLVQRARHAGIENINLDLIAGLPGQTAASWQVSLGSALALRPEHLSVYLFEIDEKSRLGNEVLAGGWRYDAALVPSEAFMAEAYGAAQEALVRAGYAQYEISNFALPGFESRHNRRYWMREPYAGLGAGAHSFDGVRRWANETAADRYVALVERDASPVAETRALTETEQIEEFFFLGLRQREGVDLAMARGRWGRDRLAPWETKIGALAAAGWLERRKDAVALSERTYLVSNEIFQEFLA
jgi:putative oxygen-independent coproporphyrinogen III oxidase